MTLARTIWNFRVVSLARERSRVSVRLITLAWDVRLTMFAWDLTLGNYHLGIFVWALELGKFQTRKFV